MKTTLKNIILLAAVAALSACGNSNKEPKETEFKLMCDESVENIIRQEVQVYELKYPDVRIHAYLTDREATLYLDTSGEPLFKRGSRRDAEEAPLRENLAAGLIALSGWQPGTAFLDPMCGSGTIAIEAASIAADRAPGLTRTFGFQKLAWFDGPA